LGTLAAQRVRLDEADVYFRKALEIKLEYNDRYGTASTYIQIGLVAAMQERIAESISALKKGLEILHVSNDPVGTITALVSIAVICEITKDGSIPSEIATVLGISIEEAERVLRKSREAQDQPFPPTGC
jgi:tetratricopeptide (TPR) repeat protein